MMLHSLEILYTIFCNFLGTVPPSDGFKLESVYVVIRHGDRNNLHSLPNYKQIELNCEMDEHMVDKPMQGYVATMKEQEEYHNSNPKTSAFHQFDLYPHSPVCQPGQLTPIGASQHVRNGLFLNRRYVNALGLFKRQEGLTVEDRILIRSTAISRTFQSAVALLYGFLPEFDMSKLGFELAETCTLCGETTGIACDCPSNLIGDGIDGMAATQDQFTPEVMVQKQTRATYEGIGDVFGVMVGQLPRPSHVFDVNMVHVCHSAYLPGPKSDVCLPAWTVKGIHSIINGNGKQQVSTQKYQRRARLKFYPLLSEIVQHMGKVAQGETNTVFHLFSGHDSTVEPIAAAINISDGHWPRYASRIVFELYSTMKKKEKVMLIRVLYDGEVTTHRLPGCSENMYKDDLGLCEFSYFHDYITRDFLKDFGHDGDYKKLCHL